MKRKEIKVEANSPFIISGRDQYIVKEGMVDVFLTKLVKGKAIGRRYFVYSANKGELVLTPDLSKQGFGVIVSGLFGTKIEAISKIDIAGVDKFINSISKPFVNSTANANVISQSNSAPGLFKTKDLSLVKGNISLLGVKTTKLISSTAILLADGKVDISKNSKDILAALNSSIDVYYTAHIAKTSFEEKKLVNRFKQKVVQSKGFMVNSLNKLLDIFSGSRTEYYSDEDPYLAVAKVIGRDLDMNIVKPKDMNSYFKDPVNEIARVSKFMTREVKLDGKWWSSDSGPVYAFMDNEPVALIPKNSKSYYVINPKRRLKVVVNKAIADRISRDAYCIYKPFPNRKLNLLDILTFSMRPSALRDFALISIMGALMGLLGMFTPIITGIIFSSVIPAAEYQTLLYISLFLVSATITTSVFSIVRSISSLRFEGRVDYMIQSAIWTRLLSLPVPFFDKFNSSDLSNRANSIIRIRQMLTGAAMSTILSAVFSVFQFFLLFYYSTSLALVGLVLTFIPIVVVFVRGKMRLKLIKESMELNSNSSNTTMQILNGISKFKIIGGEKRAFSLWADQFNNRNIIESEAQSMAMKTSTFNNIYPIITSVVIFYFVSKDSSMTVGSYLAFSGAFGSFMGSLLSLASTAVAMLNIVPLYQRAKPILESLPEVDEEKQNPVLAGGIKVKNVRYGYGEGPDVLKNIDIDINPGEFVAFVGASGSGKSTMIRLLLGFDEPRDGSVYYDTFDIKDIDVQELRRNMGVVLQNGKLMPGDIFNNIIGPFNLSMDDAWRAARATGLDGDIEDMPMKMHTVIGGGTLSGGQKQRVLIARSLVNNPNIIFFDAATSALDNKTQKIVMDSLAASNATKVVIAHRLSTIINADKIYVFDKGTIVESGNYDDLMKQDGIFAAFAKRQIA